MNEKDNEMALSKYLWDKIGNDGHGYGRQNGWGKNMNSYINTGADYMNLTLKDLSQNTKKISVGNKKITIDKTSISAKQKISDNKNYYMKKVNSVLGIV